MHIRFCAKAIIPTINGLRKETYLTVNHRIQDVCEVEEWDKKEQVFCGRSSSFTGSSNLLITASSGTKDSAENFLISMLKCLSWSYISLKTNSHTSLHKFRDRGKRHQMGELKNTDNISDGMLLMWPSAKSIIFKAQFLA